jgi:ATP-binding cassette subfamily B protein
MVLIAWLAYVLALQPDGLVKAIPILGALALGAQRLLPALQQAYGSWSAIKAGHVSLQDTLELLDQPIIDGEGRNTPSGMTFQQQVRLVDLSFRYGDQLPWVISNLNLNIYKGDRIGFIGSTGSGKSTLLDIIMGLLQPTSGKLEIDGQVVTSTNNSSWQSHIAHVPQSIYLADSTIQENIAFGVPKEKIDPHRVRKAAEEAQIAELIESWPNKYKTFVGERGVRLSGGQRQRIGIARALYKRADVIIFDEATSALDNETEQAVIKAIENLSKDLTLLIIAHRLTTLKNCNRIVELEDGGISHIGNYQEIVHQKIRVQQNGKGN